MKIILSRKGWRYNIKCDETRVSEDGIIKTEFYTQFRANGGVKRAVSANPVETTMENDSQMLSPRLGEQGTLYSQIALVKNCRQK